MGAERRPHTWRGLLPTLLLSSLLALPVTGSAATTPAPADDLGCGSAEVTRTLSTGSAWRMCVRIHPFKGLVLEDVQFRPATGDREYAGWMPVLDSLYLAQLNVPYDTGTAIFNDITSYGFGDDQLLPQTSQTCAGDIMAVEQSFMRGHQLVERTVPGICLHEVDTGLGWHSQEGYLNQGDEYVQQGRALEVSSLSKISWYEYQQTVTLTDQGTITVGLGATGDLAPGDVFFATDPQVGWPIGAGGAAPERYGASHWHNATYRVDFGIDSGPQQVEQWDYEQPDPSTPILLRGTGTVRDQAFTVEDPDPTTWWRVVNPTSLNPDGHPRSYEIVNDSTTDPYLDLARPPMSFTNDHPCQEYASMNLNAECPGQSVADYVASESDPMTDPVAWVNVGFHHIDRDEDQSPMPVHWQTFSLVPRDLLAQQATTPAERSCDNGLTVGATGSCAAVHVTPPLVTADATPPAPGTVLTAGTGTWRFARAPLSYQWLWLRDGAAITTTGPDSLPVAATGEQYAVTPADVGHAISVQVTASAAGVTPGSATSAPITVPAPLPPGSTPDVSAERAQPTLRLTVLHPARREARPRLRISVSGSLGPATGRVRLRTPGGRKVTLWLLDGRAVARLPSPDNGRYRVVVRYLGSDLYLTAKARRWVEPQSGAPQRTALPEVADLKYLAHR